MSLPRMKKKAVLSWKKVALQLRIQTSVIRKWALKTMKTKLKSLA